MGMARRPPTITQEKAILRQVIGFARSSDTQPRENNFYAVSSQSSVPNVKVATEPTDQKMTGGEVAYPPERKSI
jgi:hypothetical protein